MVKANRVKVNRRKRVRQNLLHATPDVKWAFVRAWYDDCDVSIQECADRLKMSRGYVYHSLENDTPPSQRPKTSPPRLSAAEMKVIKKRRVLVDTIARVTQGKSLHVQCRFSSAIMIAEELQRRVGAHIPWSAMTIHRDLMHMGYKNVLRPLRGKARGEYDPAIRLQCMPHLLQLVPWLVVSDEKYFDDNSHGRRRQYVPPGCIAYPRKHTQHCTTAHFWGCVGKGFRFLIEFGEDYRGLHATSSDFIRVVLSKYVEALKEHRKNHPEFANSPYVLQQDGLPIHTSKESLQFLSDMGILHLLKGQWPSWSPDLSVIENIWALMQAKVDLMPKVNLRNEKERKAELSRHVWAAWRSISQETIDEYAESSEKRFKECVSLKGEWTDH